MKKAFITCAILVLALLASAAVDASEAPIEWVLVGSSCWKCQTRYYDITSEVSPCYFDLTGLDEAFEDLQESLRVTAAGKIRLTFFSSGSPGGLKGYVGTYSREKKMIEIYPGVSSRAVGTIIHESVHYFFWQKAENKSDLVSRILLQEAAAGYFENKARYAGNPSAYSHFVEWAINYAKEVSNKYPSWKRILERGPRDGKIEHSIYLVTGLYLAETYGEGIFGDLFANYDRSNPVKSTFGVTPAQLEEGFYGWLWAQ